MKWKKLLIIVHRYIIISNLIFKNITVLKTLKKHNNVLSEFFLLEGSLAADNSRAKISNYNLK